MRAAEKKNHWRQKHEVKVIFYIDFWWNFGFSRDWWKIAPIWLLQRDLDYQIVDIGMKISSKTVIDSSNLIFALMSRPNCVAQNQGIFDSIITEICLYKSTFWPKPIYPSDDVISRKWVIGSKTPWFWATKIWSQTQRKNQIWAIYHRFEAKLEKPILA